MIVWLHTSKQQRDDVRNNDDGMACVFIYRNEKKAKTGRIAGEYACPVVLPDEEDLIRADTKETNVEASTEEDL